MYLYYIAIHIDNALYMYNDPFSSKFSYNVRFIENYLSRAVRQLKIQTGGQYTMMYVRLYNQDGYRESTVFRTLEVNINVLPEQFKAYSSMRVLEDRYEWCLSFIEEGYRQISIKRNLDLNLLMSVNDSFRNNNYKNEWLFKKIRIPQYDLYVYLKCYFTAFEFRLELEAYNYKQTVLKAKHVVLRTMPDEDFYSKEFRTVEIVGRYLVIKDFLDHDSFWIDLESVSEGVAVVIDKRDISEQDGDPLFKQILW